MERRRRMERRGDSKMYTERERSPTINQGSLILPPPNPSHLPEDTPPHPVCCQRSE